MRDSARFVNCILCTFDRLAAQSASKSNSHGSNFDYDAQPLLLPLRLPLLVKYCKLLVNTSLMHMKL